MKRGRKLESSSRPAKSGRLSLAGMEALLRSENKPPLLGLASFEFKRLPLGELGFDKEFKSAIAAGKFTVPEHFENNGILNARGIIERAFRVAFDMHTLQSITTFADDYGRLFAEELDAIRGPLERLTQLPVELMPSSLVWRNAGGKRIDVAKVIEAATFLVESAGKLPKPTDLRRPKGLTRPAFAPTLAFEAARRWRDEFGCLPPKSRPSWFSALLVAAWRDIGLSDDWPGLTDFDGWMAERAVEGITAVNVSNSNT